MVLNERKVNDLLKERDLVYPKDDDYIQNINSLKIIFDQNLINAKDLLFCPIYAKFINTLKNISSKIFSKYCSIIY